MSSDSAAGMSAEYIERMTQPCEGVGLLKVFFEGVLVDVLVNTRGLGSAFVRGLNHCADDTTLTPSGIAQALEFFSPLLGEARSEPGEYTILDLLLGLRPDQSLEFQRVATSPNLFWRLCDDTAALSDKQEAVALLDQGLVRCAEKLQRYRSDCGEGVTLTGLSTWVPQPYAIKCMNAGFSAFPMEQIGDYYYDKVPLKTEGWQANDFEAAGVRFIPGSFARKGAYIGAGTTIMPGGIVNIGAYIAGGGVMIDGGARVATGAQVGRGVKLGAGSGIEGILEPAGRLPTIIEDNVRIGANCELSGIIEEGAVVASGVVMASGKKIFDLRTNAEVEPRYMSVRDSVFEIPVIPKNRVAVGGVYQKTRELGVDCVILLEKDASDSSLANLPRNSELYVTL